MEKQIFFGNTLLDNVLNELSSCKTEEEKQAVMDHFNESAATLPDEEREKLYLSGREGAVKTLDLANSSAVSSRLKAIGEVLSYTRIAEIYFGKSRSWFHHKLNNDMVNGKVAYFTAEELNTLAESFIDLSGQLESIASLLKDSSNRSNSIKQVIH